MGYRRSRDRIAASQAWEHFCQRNEPALSGAALPPVVTAAIDNWDSFLRHGLVPGHPTAFTIDHMTPAQYELLITLVFSYFDAGYEFFTPTALRPEDQDTLRARYGR